MHETLCIRVYPVFKGLERDLAGGGIPVRFLWLALPFSEGAGTVCC